MKNKCQYQAFYKINLEKPTFKSRFFYLL